jgi:hypothetical protein
MSMRVSQRYSGWASEYESEPVGDLVSMRLSQHYSEHYSGYKSEPALQWVS